MQFLDRARRAQKRDDDISEDVDRQAQDDAVNERRQVEAEQSLRAQERQPGRAVGEDERHPRAGIGEARQQQRVGPDENAGAHADERPASRAAPPCEAAEKSRCELRHGGERQQADRGELGLAGDAIIEIGEQQDHEDGGAPHLEKEGADVAAADERRLALEHHGHEQVVRHHDGEGDRFDDHHRRRRRQAADEGGERERAIAGRQWQCQDVHVAVDDARRQAHHAGDRDRQHE